MRLGFASGKAGRALLWFALASSLPLPLFSQVEKYGIHFRSARTAGKAGETALVGIDLDNQPDKVTGFSFGVKHDGSKLTLDSVNIASGLQDALGAGKAPDGDFYFVNTTPAGGPGFTVAMILSRDDANVALLPGTNHPLFDVNYSIGVSAEGDAGVDITGALGNPKVEVILDKSGVSQAPVGAALTSAVVTVSGGQAPFIRGDANQSGHLEFLDALLIFDFLFGGSETPGGAATRDNCLVLYNFNGSTEGGSPNVEDKEDINVTDGINLLDFLFRRGLPPATPFPGCGQPAFKASARMECKDFRCPP